MLKDICQPEGLLLLAKNGSLLTVLPDVNQCGLMLKDICQPEGLLVVG